MQIACEETRHCELLFLEDAHIPVRMANADWKISDKAFADDAGECRLMELLQKMFFFIEELACMVWVTDNSLSL